MIGAVVACRRAGRSGAKAGSTARSVSPELAVGGAPPSPVEGKVAAGGVGSGDADEGELENGRPSGAKSPDDPVPTEERVASAGRLASTSAPQITDAARKAP